ncbi:MAG: tRNA (adenosine(37)-N6)-threonylcarbamoyltransferase complex ATPase subunit type 1 TsaE [Rhodospirillaceae bacterium]|nr:tRNA (adenosine(37)-N6)-threonylcarbamoyltransferase complex ATPase subunit type 1 TsaE [Rhodospirillaceae bacterium]
MDYLRRSPALEIALPAEADTRALGQAIARRTQQGDMIALEGGLGAGKTTLARGFIQHFTGSVEEVVSPTFTLAQLYDGPVPIWHFDLYRLKDPMEVLELGLEDALTEGIVLVEWPERMGHLLPQRRLEVGLALGLQNGRQARLAGDPSWAARIKEIGSDVAR